MDDQPLQDRSADDTIVGDGEPKEQGGETSERSRGRASLSIALIVLVALLAPLTVVAGWAVAQIEDTDRYVATVGPLAEDPEVQAYVAAALTETMYELLRVEELLDETLPDELARLAPVIGPAVRGTIGDAANRFTASPAFVRLWEDANRAAHTIIRGVLTGDSKVTDLEGGQLTLDLNALLRALQTRLVESGVTLVADLDLSGVDRSIVLIEGEQLESIAAARTMLSLLKTFSWLLFIATIAAAVGSVVVARDRGRAIRRLGVAVALSMVLVAVGLSIARRAFLEAIAGGLPRPVAAGFFDAVAGSMRTGFRGTFVIGLLLALLVLIAGRRDFVDRWARPTQIAVGALGVLAIVARDQPDAAGGCGGLTPPHISEVRSEATGTGCTRDLTFGEFR